MFEFGFWDLDVAQAEERYLPPGPKFFSVVELLQPEERGRKIEPSESESPPDMFVACPKHRRQLRKMLGPHKRMVTLHCRSSSFIGNFGAILIWNLRCLPVPCGSSSGPKTSHTDRMT